MQVQQGYKVYKYSELLNVEELYHLRPEAQRYRHLNVPIMKASRLLICDIGREWWLQIEIHLHDPGKKMDHSLLSSLVLLDVPKCAERSRLCPGDITDGDEM